MIHLLICLGDVHHAFTLTSDEFKKQRLKLLRYSSLVIDNARDLYLKSVNRPDDQARGFITKDRFGIFQTERLSTAQEVADWIDMVLAGETNG